MSTASQKFNFPKPIEIRVLWQLRTIMFNSSKKILKALKFEGADNWETSCILWQLLFYTAFSQEFLRKKARILEEEGTIKPKVHTCSKGMHHESTSLQAHIYGKYYQRSNSSTFKDSLKPRIFFISEERNAVWQSKWIECASITGRNGQE